MPDWFPLLPTLSCARWQPSPSEEKVGFTENEDEGPGGKREVLGESSLKEISEGGMRRTTAAKAVEVNPSRLESRNATFLEDGASSQVGVIVSAAAGSLTALASRDGNPCNGPPPPAEKSI